MGLLPAIGLQMPIGLALTLRGAWRDDKLLSEALDELEETSSSEKHNKCLHFDIVK
jgi:hypothetical protein